MLNTLRNWFGGGAPSRQTVFCKGTIDCIFGSERGLLGFESELEEAWLGTLRPVLDELFSLPAPPGVADPWRRALLIDVTLDLSQVATSVTGLPPLANLLLAFTPAKVLFDLNPLTLRRTRIRLHGRIRDPADGVVIARHTVTRRLSWLRTQDRNLAWTAGARSQPLRDLVVDAGLDLLQHLAKAGARL